MHPAFSVIFLTTLIGAGQGLFLALYTGQVYNTFGVIGGDAPVSFYAFGSVLVMLFMLLGLFASFFHLGRPERAWRAATMWRTSWLSREVIVLPAFTAMAFSWGAMHYLGFDPVVVVTSGNITVHLTLIIGAVATILAFLLYLCTAMIYAAVKFIQEWATPLTVVNYLLLGSGSGFILAAVIAAWYGNHLVSVYAVWGVLITLTGFVTRLYSLRRNARLKRKTTPTTAIGIRHPSIRQISQGAMGGSFNTREFFHHASPRVVSLIKALFPLLAFVLPVTLLLVGWSQQCWGLMALAFVVQYLGLLLERWFFFAQAWHPQNIYYQAT